MSAGATWKGSLPGHSARISASWCPATTTHTNGFYRNEFDGKKNVDQQHSYNINGRLIGNLDADTAFDAKVRYGELHGASINFNSSFSVPNFAGVNPAFYEDVNKHKFRYYSNIAPTNDQKTFEASLKLDHDFGGVKLTGWTLYSNIRNSLTADGTSADFARYINAATPAGQPAVDACFASTAALTGFPVNQPGALGAIPVPFIFAPANGLDLRRLFAHHLRRHPSIQRRTQKDISAEIRLASDGSGPLEWQVGAYYLHIDREAGVSLGADTADRRGSSRTCIMARHRPTRRRSFIRTSSRPMSTRRSAASIITLTDALDVNAALRYDIERRRDDNLVPVANDPVTGGPINPGLVGGPADPLAEGHVQAAPAQAERPL